MYLLTCNNNCNGSVFLVTLMTKYFVALSLPSKASHSQGPECSRRSDFILKIHLSLRESIFTEIPLYSSSGSCLVPLGLKEITECFLLFLRLGIFTQKQIYKIKNRCIVYTAYTHDICLS